MYGQRMEAVKKFIYLFVDKSTKFRRMGDTARK